KPKQKPFPNPGNPNVGGPDLTGTSWTGTENLPGYGALTFKFNGPNAVTMIDVKGNTEGNYQVNGQAIALNFGGDVRYNGQINGDNMGGKAVNGMGQNWDWQVTRQANAGAEVQQPPAGEPGVKPPPGKLLIPDVYFGTGAIIDAKHRLM